MALNEIRLDSRISDELLTIDGYDIIRAGRNRNGGGVCIYIRCHVNYEKLPDMISTGLEAVCFEIKQTNSRSFIYQVSIGLQVPPLRYSQKLKS